MDQVYGLHSMGEYSDMVLMSLENLITPAEHHALISSGNDFPYPSSNIENDKPEDEHGQVSSLIKARIASHPSYPKLLDAYLDCQKVGAPPEIASLLDKIRQDPYEVSKQDETPVCVGVDPELDDFMESYYDILVKYKSNLSRSFDEATSFVDKIQTQLRNLRTDSGVFYSDEEFSGVTGLQNAEIKNDDDGELKQSLVLKYGSYINNLKQELSKKKKMRKIPNQAKKTLLEWWNTHYKWPYPTEADKVALAASTGLEQKQIINWFINQRKRHWRPSENMQFAAMDNLSGDFFIHSDEIQL